MKKVLAVVLSLIMMFAVCVPAFAAPARVTITNSSTEQSGDVLVSTTTEGVTSATYTVTIPADTKITWGSPKTGMQYSMTSQLELGKVLKVAITSANGQKLKHDTFEIPYTYSSTNGGVAIDSPDTTADQEVFTRTVGFNIDIAAASWTAVPVAEYTDTLTFTVSIVDKPAA